MPSYVSIPSDPMEPFKDAAIRDVMAEMWSSASKIMEINGAHYVSQDIFVIEECAETVIELMKLVKTITKWRRSKAKVDELESELIDVFASGYLLLKKIGCPDDKIIQGMKEKYERAIERAGHDEF